MSRPERKLTIPGAVAAVAPVVAVGGMAYANYLLNPDLLKFSDHKNYPLYAMLSAMLVGTGTSAVAGLMQKNNPLLHAFSNALLLGGTAIMAMGDAAQLQKSDSAKVLAVGLTLFLYSTASMFYHVLRAMNLVSEAPRLEVSFTSGGAVGALFFAMGNAMNLYAAHQKGDHNKMAAAGLFDGASALFMYTMIYATVMKVQEMSARVDAVAQDVAVGTIPVVLHQVESSDSIEGDDPTISTRPLARTSQADLTANLGVLGSRSPQTAADTTIVTIPGAESNLIDPLLSRSSRSLSQ